MRTLLPFKLPSNSGWCVPVARVDLACAATPPLNIQLSSCDEMCRYDDLQSAQDNIDLQSTILSRFDLIFIVRDHRSMETDKLIARCH